MLPSFISSLSPHTTQLFHWCSLGSCPKPPLIGTFQEDFMSGHHTILLSSLNSFAFSFPGVARNSMRLRARPHSNTATSDPTLQTWYVDRPLSDALASCTACCGSSSSGTTSLQGHSECLHRTPRSPVPIPRGRPMGTPSPLPPWLCRDWELLAALAWPKACLEFQDCLWNVQPVWRMLRLGHRCRGSTVAGRSKDSC